MIAVDFWMNVAPWIVVAFLVFAAIIALAIIEFALLALLAVALRWRADRRDRRVALRLAAMVRLDDHVELSVREQVLGPETLR